MSDLPESGIVIYEKKLTVNIEKKIIIQEFNSNEIKKDDPLIIK